VTNGNTRVEDLYGSGLAKFINGSTEFSDANWNAFVSSLVSAGGRSMETTYNSAYEKYKTAVAARG
jgi:hypothetical protein